MISGEAVQVSRAFRPVSRSPALRERLFQRDSQWIRAAAGSESAGSASSWLAMGIQISSGAVKGIATLCAARPFCAQPPLAPIARRLEDSQPQSLSAIPFPCSPPARLLRRPSLHEHRLVRRTDRSGRAPSALVYPRRKVRISGPPPGCRSPITKKQAHHFLQAPDDFDLMSGFRWAQISDLGGSERQVRSVLTTRARDRFS